MGYSLSVLIEEGVFLMRKFFEFLLVASITLFFVSLSSFLFLHTYIEYKSYNSECVSVSNEKQD